MTADDVRAIGRRMYEAFNAHDFGAAETIFSLDFVSHPLGTTGVESVTKSWARFHAQFPDAQVIVEDLLVDGDKAAVRTTVHGIPAVAADQARPTCSRSSGCTKGASPNCGACPR